MTGEYDGSIRFNTEIDDSALPEQMAKVGDKLRTLSATLRDVMQGPIAAVMELGAVFQKLKGTLDELENEWAKQEQSVAILNSTLQATGAESWTSSEALQGMASNLQKLTGYSDDAVISMESVLLGFKNIKGVQFDAAVEQILNMAKVMGMDLRSAAQAVGKALDDPIAGVDSLVRQGFRFSDSQKEVLKQMVETGDRAGAQTIILNELSTTFGGTAAAAYDTASALRDKLGNAVSDMHKQMGYFVSEALAPMRKSLIAATEGIEEWFKRINENGEAPEFLDKLATALGMVTAGLTAFVLVSQGSAIVEGMAAAITALNAALLANPYALAAAGIAAIAVAIAGFIKTQEDHTTAMENAIAKSGEMQGKAKALADEYQNLHDKANLTATEQERMATIAKTLTDQYPNLNQATLDAAAANGTLAKKAGEAALAQQKLYAGQQIPKLEAQYVELSKTILDMGDTLQAAKQGKPVLPGGYSLKDYEALINEAKKKLADLGDKIVEYKNLAYYGIIPAQKPSKPAGTPAGTEPLVSEGYAGKLEELDKEHDALIAVAEQTGDDTVGIDAEYYKKRLALLGDFVVENAKKNISAADSLKQILGGKYKSIGEEIQATLSKQQNNTGFNPEGATLAAAGEGVQQADVESWTEDYLGAAAFKAISDAATQGLQDSDVAEWATDYLGKQSFDALQKAAGEALSASDAEEWVQTYLGDKAFKALQDAATQGLQDADVAEWVQDYLGKQAFQAISDAATLGLQNADVDEWTRDFLGKKAFEAIMANAEQGLQDADVAEWATDYLGKQAFDAISKGASEGLSASDAEEWVQTYLGDKAFKALQDAATQGLQDADVQDWIVDYLGKQAFQALSDAATQGLQDADVAEWTSDYLGAQTFKAIMASAEQGLQDVDVQNWAEEYLGKETFDALMKAAEEGLQNADVAEWIDNYLKDKKIKILLDDAEIKQQTAAMQAWIDDYIKNHGTNQGGGDLWMTSYERYLEEMAEKTNILYPIIQGVKTSWKQTIDDMGEKVNDWEGVINSVFNAVTTTIGGAFETLGRQIAGQTGGWTNWGNAALKALAGVLRALGYQLMAQAAYNAVLAVTHLLMLDFAGAAAGAASAAVALAAGGAALVGAGIVDGMADANTEAHKFTDALAQQNNTLKQSIELWTQAGKAGEAYSSILGKVKEAATQFYGSLQSIGAEITSTIIDSLVNGFSGDDFLYSIEQYITKAVIQAAVFTESFMTEVASIGQAIATGIANGFSEDDLKSLKERLATLYANAAAAANLATDLVQSVFASYDTGTLNVQGDQLARIHNNEMILPPGIAQEARMQGMYIGPVGNIDAAGSAAFPRAATNINLTLDGSIQVDGREIGRVAWRYSDELAGAAYGNG